MQEDYFLKAPVQNQLVEEFVQFMEEHSEVKCLHVLNWQGYGTEEYPYKGFKQNSCWTSLSYELSGCIMAKRRAFRDSC